MRFPWPHHLLIQIGPTGVGALMTSGRGRWRRVCSRRAPLADAGAPTPEAVGSALSALLETLAPVRGRAHVLLANGFFRFLLDKTVAPEGSPPAPERLLEAFGAQGAPLDPDTALRCCPAGLSDQWLACALDRRLLDQILGSLARYRVKAECIEPQLVGLLERAIPALEDGRTPLLLVDELAVLAVEVTASRIVALTSLPRAPGWEMQVFAWLASRCGGELESLSGRLRIHAINPALARSLHDVLGQAGVHRIRPL